jgi:septal ring factor EnvC (AmiA/AmiB activator)
MPDDEQNGQQAPITRADLDRFMQIMADEFTQTRAEIGQVRGQIANLTSHVDRIDASVASIFQTLASFTREHTAIEQQNREIQATQHAQQRSIDDLYSRVRKLEGPRP